jgi:hypothetical protein
VKLNDVFKLSYLPELIERKINGAEKGSLPDADLEFYRREHERLVKELETAAEKSILPEKPTAKEELNDLLIRLRLKNHGN